MDESIDFRLKKRIVNSLYALAFLSGILLISLLLEKWL